MKEIKEKIKAALKGLSEKIESASLDKEAIIKHSEKIKILNEAIKYFPEELLDSASTTVSRDGRHLVENIARDQELLKKIDYSIFFICQTVVERALRCEDYVQDKSYKLYKWFMSQESYNEGDMAVHRAALGKVLLSILYEESKDARNQLQKIEKEIQEFATKQTNAISEKEKQADEKFANHQKNIETLDSKVESYIKRVKELKSELSFVALGKACSGQVQPDTFI